MAEVIKPPWLPEGLYQSWLTAYNEAGGAGVTNSATTATEVVRNSAEYDSYFPGMRREDGSLRYEYNPEATYFNNIEAYRNAVQGVDVNPALLEEEYIALIKGDVSPQEFNQRVNVLADRIDMGSVGSDIRNWYAENYGIDMTNSGIIASLMSDRVNSAVLERNITMSEIGGEASMRNYDITNRFVGMLADQGMDRQQADQLFGSAEKMLPMLSSLAARHGDADDDFDIEEFALASGSIAGGRSQELRAERLLAQERSTFTGGAQLDYKKGQQTGGVAGLAQS